MSKLVKIQTKQSLRKPVKFIMSLLAIFAAAAFASELQGWYAGAFPVINPATNSLGWYRWCLLSSLLDPILYVVPLAVVLFLPRWLLRLVDEARLTVPNCGGWSLFPPLLILPILVVFSLLLIQNGVGPARQTVLVYGSDLSEPQHLCVGYLITIGKWIQDLLQIGLTATACLIVRLKRPPWPLAALAGYLALDALRILESDLMPPYYQVRCLPPIVYAVAS